nr:DUF4944 domain-containing protein [Bacillus glycinifermentans]
MDRKQPGWKLAGRDKKKRRRPRFQRKFILDRGRASLRETYLERLVVTFDDEVALSSGIETPMIDYSGGTFPDGGLKEDSVSF